MLRTPVAIVLLFASLAAQDRRPLLGTVVDGDGKPLAGATVCFGYVPFGGEDLPPHDQGTTTTDARGRFKADVLPCASYSLWAVGPEADAGRATSGIVHAAAGALVELRATARRTDWRLTIEGLDAWQEAGPFTIRLFADTVALPGAPLAVAADGTVELPLLLPAIASFDLCDRAGEVLATLSVPTKADGKAKLQPPQTVPMRVFDAKGQPLAGAEVEQRFSRGWNHGLDFGPYRPGRTIRRRLGTTDADGMLVARVPFAKDPFRSSGYRQLYFLAKKPGHAASLSGFTDQLFLDGKEVADKDRTELSFHLPAALPLAARFTTTGGRGLAGQPVVVRSHLRIEEATNSGWQAQEATWLATTDAEGRITIADLPLNVGELSMTLLATKAELGMPEPLRRSAPPLALAPLRFQSRPDHEVVVDLATYHTVQLRLLEADKSPARGATVLLAPEHPETAWDAGTMQATPDPAGRLNLLLAPGAWTVFVRSANSMACQRLVVEHGLEATLALSPMPAMRGRVVGKDGKPIAGATLDVVSMSRMGLDGLRPPEEQVAEHLNWKWLDDVRSDADGNFLAPFVPVSGASYEAVFHHGQRQSARFQVQAGADPVTITID
ncbi:MAG: carboxypeptidase regulatory-like domain-containing protein [Planctomycetes bacterium]|nr:carboxypeptidase regulatory-like domain-containing protein [Planctomycetota bacterium]